MLHACGLKRLHCISSSSWRGDAWCCAVHHARYVGSLACCWLASISLIVSATYGWCAGTCRMGRGYPTLLYACWSCSCSLLCSLSCRAWHCCTSSLPRSSGATTCCTRTETIFKRVACSGQWCVLFLPPGGPPHVVWLMHGNEPRICLVTLHSHELAKPLLARYSRAGSPFLNRSSGSSI